MVSLTTRVDETALKVLRRYADEEIRKILEPVEGVAAVKISGGLEDEVQIEIDQRKMAQLNLSLDDLTARLAAENVNVSAGRLEEGTQRYLVRTINQFESVEAFGDLIVSTGEGRPCLSAGHRQCTLWPQRARSDHPHERP